MSATIRTLASALLLALVLAACGGGGDTTDEATEQADAGDPADADGTESDAPEDDSAGDGGKETPDLDAPTAPDAPDAPDAPEPPADPAPAPAAPATLEPNDGPPPESMDAIDAMGDDIGSGGAATYASYTTITDDTGAIQLEVPSEWTDIDGRPYEDEQGRQLFDVRASTDLQGFTDTWDVPGVVVTASREVAQTENEVTLLDELVDGFSGVCTYLGREPYDDGLYRGQVDLYDSCGGTETGYVVLGAVPTSRAFVIRLQVQVVEERDLEALGRALNSFVIVGDV